MLGGTMLSEPLTLDEVLAKYRMRVTDTQRKQRYLPKPSLRDYSMIDGDGISIDPIWMMTEKMFTIEITESDLDRLGDHLNYFHQARNPYERQEMEEREAYIRKKNPAVKKAWENYKMLLKLAAEGKTFD